MSNESERREFLKTAGAAALGGLAVTVVAGGEAEAQNIAMRAPGKASRTLMLRTTPDVTLDHIMKAIQQGIRPFGCLACGLLGVDIHIHTGDPEPFEIKEPGIAGAAYE